MFREVGSKIDFPYLEEGILSFWKERGIFNKSIEAREGAQHYVFYEGPPTANGNPGVHHVLSRLFKDIICRYKTMKGYYVPRKAGWDTHGLPVELEVERSLGFTNKAQIEKYGVARFNDLCRKSALNYIKEWEAMTERIGCWLDMEHPYITLDSSYIESCWWIVKKLWDRGLIYQSYKVTPHCPRCGTSLSSHEVALGYRDDAEDPSVYIKFKLHTPSLKADSYQLTAFSMLEPSILACKPVYFLVWTTTPWTLPGNTALAVAPCAEYSLLEGEDDCVILASHLIDKVGLDGYTQLGVVSGESLVHLEYEPLFNPHKFDVPRLSLPSLNLEKTTEDLTYPVIGADFVSLEEGTGVVHIAPAFGEVDFDVGMDNGLDFVQPVDLEGKIIGNYPFSGKFVKDADPAILDDLKARGLLYRSEKIIHTYPFCWRCESPLLYYAKKAWYIKTTAVKDKLISGNNEINWYPDYIKHGRFGDWLENNVDWAFSRERYWGTPLPIWHCESCDNYECIGSVDELKAVSRQPSIIGDLHRPYVDEIVFACSKCGGEMRRVPEVIDCWFDSGAMPVAQWHYPFENKDKFEQNFPADFICEAVDQTRGWFYSLHTISTLLFGCPCFKNVICLGHVVDAQGEKMSKSKGNVINPGKVVSTYGADALRWYMLVSASGEDNHRFSTQMLAESERKFLLTLWNTYSFFTTYANIDQFVPHLPISCHSECVSRSPDPEPAEGEWEESHLAQDKLHERVSFSMLDNWIISELNRLIVEVTKVSDNYNPTSAARKIEAFVDNLSNWWVRRSRRRFWRSENDADKSAAYTTLYQCLVTLSQLLAPFIPFISEELYQNLVRSVNLQAKESVHLTDYPVANEAKIDDELNNDVELAMKIASLGRAARAKAGIKVRQPLGKMVVKVSSTREEKALQKLADEISEEVNVKEIVVAVSRSPERGEGEAKQSPEQLAAPGYSIASDAKYWVAISTDLPSELVAEGTSREIVRRLQTMRRAAKFDITDHIVTYYQAEEGVKQVIADFAGYIKQETLSQELIDGFPPDGAYSEKHRISNSDVLLAIKKVT